MDTTQCLSADSRNRWAGAVVVTGDERHKQNVPEGGNFLNMGSSKNVNFGAYDTKLGTVTQLVKGITTLYKKFNWVYIARTGHLHRICTSFYFSKAAGQNNGMTRLKLCDLTASAGGHVLLWLPVMDDTSSTCQMGGGGGDLKHGILQVCECFSWSV